MGKWPNNDVIVMGSVSKYTGLYNCCLHETLNIQHINII